MSPRGYELPDTRSLQQSPGAELAHRNIDLNSDLDRAYLDGVTSRLSLSASAKSWKNYREIGEVRYSVSRSAKIAGYSNLYGERVNLTGEKTNRAEAGIVAEIVADISSRFGGTRGLIERFYTLRQIPGETYLTAVRDNSDSFPDGYWFLSPSEIGAQENFLSESPNKSIKWTTARTGTVVGEKSVFDRMISPDDFRGRIWAPTGEYLDNADSPMYGVNHLCEMLQRIEQSIMARLQSRFAMNGILAIPSEINDAAISGALPAQADYGTNDKVLRYFMHTMTRNVMLAEGMGEAGAAAGAMPIMVKGPSDALQHLRHIINEQMVADTDLKLRGDIINQILDGLDQQRAQVQDSSTDRFSAWTRSDSERRITVQPVMEEMCHAVTRMILWRELKERGWTPRAIRGWRVWYDLSAAAVKSNLADEARQSFDRGVTNAAHLRKATGATDLDVMDPEEYVRWVGTKTQDPYLMLYGMDDDIDVDWDMVGRSGNPGPSPDDTGESDPQSNPGQGDPGAPGDRSIDDQTPDDDGS